MAVGADGAVYSTRIIKAGALLPDTKLLLREWNPATDVPTNLSRVRRENLFGKSSRSRVEDVLAVFRQRYLMQPHVLHALVTLVRSGIQPDALDRILYFQAAQSDRLLHDLVTDAVHPWSSRADKEVRVQEVDEWVERRVAASSPERPWSPEVRRRVVQGLLSTLRDFGILEGTIRKRIASVFLPTEAFAFVAFQLHATGSAGERLVHNPDWRLYLLPELAVERSFLEAHQEGLLRYHAAGRVVRIDFPAATLEEYGRVLADRNR